MDAIPGSHKPQVLILASRYDLTCDFVVAQLRTRSVPYLRLNTEDLSDSIVCLDPVGRHLVIKQSGGSYYITPDHLRSVFFRRPVFLRDYGDDHRSPEDRFSRLHWMAFVRNLMLFEEACWINNPATTYKAEHKAVQLSLAATLGFAVPETRVTNAPSPQSLGALSGQVAIKGLDTVLLRDQGHEMFGFTTFECREALRPA